MSRIRSIALTIFGGVALLGVPGSEAQNEPDKRAALVGPTGSSVLVTQKAAQLLVKKHLTQRPVDAEVANRWLRLFLEDLDLSKLYFSQQDVDGFRAKLGTLPERLQQGDLSLAYEIFKRYLERLDERQAVGRRLLGEPLDLTGEEEIVVDPRKASFPKSDDEVRAVWRRRIAYELLQQKADGFKDAEAVARIQRKLKVAAERMKQIDDDELVEIALTSLARAFDSKSTYIGPRSWRQYQDSLRSQFDGIGAQLQLRDGACRIVRVVPGGAAHKDGRLKENDVIVGVGSDDKAKIVDVTEMRLTDIVRLLRGPRDSKVRLEVIPAGQSERLLYTLVRAPVVTTKVRGAVVEARKDDGTALKVGYLLVPSLYRDPSGKGSADDAKALLTGTFRDRGVDLVILDLRTNNGGMLVQAIALAELFLAERPIMQVKTAAGQVHTYNGQARTASWDGPLVVLTSRQTASGAEIVAGALQSHGRGLVVGESTNGVGTVQSLFEVGANTKLEDPKLGVLRITAEIYYRPNGESTQKRGVVPDVELPWMVDPGAGEAASDFTVEFDRIDALRYDRFKLGIDEDLRGKLRKQSQQRRQASPEFQTLAELIALSARRAERGMQSLNAKKFLDERAALARLPADAVRQRKVEEAADVERDFYFEEALAIARDYWRELKK